MGRLTSRNPKNGLAYLVNVKSNEQEIDSAYPNTLRCILEAFNRLAEYEENVTFPYEEEDTGFPWPELRCARCHGYLSHGSILLPAEKDSFCKKCGAKIIWSADGRSIGEESHHE